MLQEGLIVESTGGGCVAPTIALLTGDSSKNWECQRTHATKYTAHVDRGPGGGAAAAVGVAAAAGRASASPSLRRMNATDGRPVFLRDRYREATQRLWSTTMGRGD